MVEIQENVSKYKFLSSFWLKIIALVTMTIDHLGVFIAMNFPNYPKVLYDIFRCVGRLSMPLFAFMIAEGVMYTKNIKKYLLRLGIMAIFVSITIAICSECFGQYGYDLRLYGNIFIDLFLGALAGWLILQPNKKLKWLSLLPILYCIGAFSVSAFEYTNNYTIHWFPYFIRGQYNFGCTVLIVLFCVAPKFVENYFSWYEQKNNLPEGSFKGTNYMHLAISILNIVFLLGVMVLYKYLIDTYKMQGIPSQLFAIFAGLLLLLYNNKRGYSKKWFAYGCYLYYPLHIGILALIFYLITL